MTNTSLAQSYLVKATKRLRILEVLFDDEAFWDVVREAQEVVELCLKGGCSARSAWNRHTGMTCRPC